MHVIMCEFTKIALLGKNKYMFPFNSLKTAEFDKNNGMFSSYYLGDAPLFTAVASHADLTPLLQAGPCPAVKSGASPK